MNTCLVLTMRVPFHPRYIERHKLKQRSASAEPEKGPGDIDCGYRGCTMNEDFSQGSSRFDLYDAGGHALRQEMRLVMGRDTDRQID